jgi:hypothetical protein
LVLEGAGFRCLAAENAMDAEALARLHRPIVVLADSLVAGIDERFAVSLREPDWRPRFALMSAHPRPVRGPEDYFVPKPIEFDHLLQLIESVARDFER